MFLLYHEGLEGPRPIYDLQEIERAKSLPDFSREYLGQYLGVVGNVFSPASIEKCQSVQYNPHTLIPNVRISVGIDPSFGGTSKFGIVATRFVNERIECVIAEEHNRPDFSSMISRIFEIKQQMGISACYVDAANPEVWQSLKKEVFDEPYGEAYIAEKVAYCKKNNLDLNTYMVCIPVPFSTQGRQMLQHAKSLVEDPDGLVLIDKSFDKLLMALRTASAEDSRLQKEQTSYNDVLDAFRLSCQYYRRSK
jgi:ABC-type sugar transport system ATPase subunit